MTIKFCCDIIIKVKKGGKKVAEQSGFFNALEFNGMYDRTYDASDFANYFAMFIGTGVFVNPTNNLQVVAKSGLTVTVKKGNAFIDGYWYELTEDKDITFSPNATRYETKNVVCCTLNKTNRTIIVNKKEGVSSILPVNNGTVHELVLSDIVLGVGVSTITNAVITDRRADKTYCGFVKGTVDQIDTTDLFLQFTTAFTEWFDSIKGQFGEDVAGNLQNQIDTIKQDMTTVRYGEDPPNDSVGKDGDVYIQIVE